MEFIADAAGFSVEMNGTFSLSTYMQLTAVKEIESFEMCMPAPEGCRKHGEYL
jgi:hypothetical protein